MSQISAPLRIVLGLAVAFLIVWTFFLRPGEPAPEPAATTAAPGRVEAGGDPAETALGRTVEGANDAAAVADGQATAVEGDAPATPAVKPGTTTRPSSVPVPDLEKAAMARLPKDVRSAIRRNEPVVLLFWSPKASDDRRARRELKRAGTHDGDVTVHIANIRDISRYASITRGANVQQSPTFVVVDGNRRVETITGYAEHHLIKQAMSDALRASR